MAGRRPPTSPRGAVPRGGYVILPDQSLCHGPGVWSNPYCEWPIERSFRDFKESSWEYHNGTASAERTGAGDDEHGDAAVSARCQRARDEPPDDGQERQKVD